jgi:hypothetical protein
MLSLPKDVAETFIYRELSKRDILSLSLVSKECQKKFSPLLLKRKEDIERLSSRAFIDTGGIPEEARWKGRSWSPRKVDYDYLSHLSFQYTDLSKGYVCLKRSRQKCSQWESQLNLATHFGTFLQISSNVILLDFEVAAMRISTSDGSWYGDRAQVVLKVQTFLENSQLKFLKSKYSVVLEPDENKFEKAVQKSIQEELEKLKKTASHTYPKGQRIQNWAYNS